MSKRFAPNGATPQHTATKVRTEIDTQKSEYGRLKATVRDKNGNIIKHLEQKVDSLTTNFWQIVYGIHAEINSVTLPITSGGTTGVRLRDRTSNGGLENEGGISVGSSAATVTYGQTALVSPIQPGVGTGQLSYEQTSNFYNPVTNTVEIVRTFVNADTNAADITVRECGLNNVSSTPPTPTAIMYCRDVLETELVIPFEGVLTIVYTITFANGNANYTRIMNALGYRALTSGTLLTNIVNVTGTSFSGSPGTSQNYGLLAFEGDDNNGIVVGTTNSNPTTLNTWALESKVSHGTGAGQLFYYASTITSFEENNTTNSCRWYLNRVVQNRSGSTIAVNEIGLFCNITTTANAVFMVDRKFPDEGAVAITNGSFATLSWEFCYNL